MGRITVKVEGSLPEPTVHHESAQVGGHAAAIGRAIERLAAMLPAAIQRDHDLHEDGSKPGEAPFGHRRPSGG